MKAFFERYSYEAVRMALNQVVTAIFGFALAIAAATAKNDTLLLVTSLGAIAFYLVLTYGTAWRMGSRDKITVDRGLRARNPWIGLLVAMLANSLNFLLAIIGSIGMLFDISVLSLGKNAALLIQGMYQGLLAVIRIGEAPLNEFFWVYFLLPLPAMLISLLAYNMGVKDFHLTRLGAPELPASDRPTKKELRERKKQEKK